MACPPKNGDIWSSGSSHHASDGPYKTDPEDKSIQVRTNWTCIVSHALNLGLRVTWPQCSFSAFEQLIRESGRVKCSSMSASQQVTRQWEPQVLVAVTNRSVICQSEYVSDSLSRAVNTHRLGMSVWHQCFNYPPIGVRECVLVKSLAQGAMRSFWLSATRGGGGGAQLTGPRTGHTDVAPPQACPPDRWQPPHQD